MASDEDAEWGLVCQFWIDTPAYTQRDQEMFVAGYEFCEVLAHIRHFPEPCVKTIHRENESRVRMAAAKFGRQVTIEPCEPEHDPDGTWSYLRIEEQS